jgi:hypothetical protein
LIFVTTVTTPVGRNRPVADVHLPTFSAMRVVCANLALYFEVSVISLVRSRIGRRLACTNIQVMSFFEFLSVGLALILLRALLQKGSGMGYFRKFRTAAVSFDGEVLHFQNYPFEPATVFPSGQVCADDVQEVRLSYPSELRLKSGDILFVPHDGKVALMNFVNRHNIRLSARRAVWDTLLEPYLDTSQTEEEKQKDDAWLAQQGLNSNAVRRWRREVGGAMMAMNFGTGLWEWVSFGLHDVLIAKRAFLGKAAFADFYWRAVTLAASDVETPLARICQTAASIETALHSVLIEWFPPMQKGNLSSFNARWKARSEKINGLVASLKAELVGAYSEPHRHYHTVAHIERCLASLCRYEALAARPAQVRWALLFHDAVYDSRRQDNEVQSADWACRLMRELGRPDEEIASVRGLIMATTHQMPPRSSDAALLLDIDCEILGASEPRWPGKFPHFWPGQIPPPRDGLSRQ